MNFFTLRRKILKIIVPSYIWKESVELHGISIPLKSAPYSFGIKKLLQYNIGNYEKPEILFCHNFINSGDKVLEFGSSIGILTSIIAKKVGPNGFVLAVEADKELTTYSKTWIEPMGNVKILTAFAFPIYHKRPIGLKFDNDGGSLGGKITFTKDSLFDKMESCFFIEDAVNKFNFSPNVLVCDIEGSEILVIDENPQLPKSIEKIMIELHPGIYGFEKSLEIILAIRNQGFELTQALGSVYFFNRHLNL